MKNLKLILASLALVCGIGAALAFTFTGKSVDRELQTSQWYYIPSTSQGENDPDNYQLATGQESCPGSQSVRCIIEAPDDGTGQPDLSDPSQVTELSFKF